MSMESDRQSKADDTMEKETSEVEKDVCHSKERDIEKQADETSQQEMTPAPLTEEEDHDPSLVEFDGPDDPEDPKNWPTRRKATITMAMGLMTFVVTFSSSIFAVAIEPVAQEFNVGIPVATLGVSFFLLGFVLGPAAFGPASEVFGRRTPLMLGYFVFLLFNLPVALGTNIETILIGRFIGGLAASAPIAIVGGCLADMFYPIERTYAICAFAGGNFVGPAKRVKQLMVFVDFYRRTKSSI